MARKPRGLRPEDRELWDRVTAKATPLVDKTGLWTETALPDPKPKPRPNKTAATDPPAPLPAGFRIGERASPTQPHGKPHGKSPARPLIMDAKLHGKMKRGKIAPDARIDLHGLTQEQALPALTRFIMMSHATGHRLVLVITGKGKMRDEPGPIPARKGVLRHHVPHWLRTGVLQPMVLDVSEAHLKHGGSGAYYVYLRRKR